MSYYDYADIYSEAAGQRAAARSFFPDEMPRPQFYRPAGRGMEHHILKGLDHWAALWEERAATQPTPGCPSGATRAGKDTP